MGAGCNVSEGEESNASAFAAQEGDFHVEKTAASGTFAHLLHTLAASLLLARAASVYLTRLGQHTPGTGSNTHRDHSRALAVSIAQSVPFAISNPLAQSVSISLAQSVSISLTFANPFVISIAFTQPQPVHHSDNDANSR